MACNRCGKCCLTMVEPSFWETAGMFFIEPSLICHKDVVEKVAEKKQTLLDERKKYPANDGGCKMLIFENGIAACLIENLLGKDKKPKVCQEYNEDGKCEAQNDRRNDERGTRVAFVPLTTGR